MVVVKDNDLPAMILDEDLDELIKRKAAPGLFRMAVEAAAHQRYFGDQARSGAAYHESETAWEEAKSTQQRVAPALTGAAAGDLTGWKSQRGYRFPTLAICAFGTHRGSMLDRDSIRDLRKTVRDIVEKR